MKNLTTTQNGISQTADSLMWLKIEGYRQNKNSTGSATAGEKSQPDSLDWLKQDENYFQKTMVRASGVALRYDLSGKNIILSILLVLLMSLFAMSKLQAQSSPIVITPTVTNVSCNGGNDGVITTNVTGGQPPYTFLWSTGATTQNLAGLTASPPPYTITVIDAQGDYDAITINITQPDPLIAVPTITNATGGNNNGAISLAINGGTPGYSFFWNNGSTNQNLTGLAAGTYTVVILDANGCNLNYTVIVGANSSPPIFTSADATICAGSCATLSVSSPNDPNYIYTWAPASAGLNTNQGSTVIACPLVTTTYTVTGTDILTGDYTTATITITVVPQPDPVIIEGNVTVCDGSPGFYLHVHDLGSYSGGYPSGTTFDWGAGPSNDDTYFVTGTGDYVVTVTLPAYLGSCSQISSLIHVIFLPSPVVVLTDSDCCINATPGFSSYIWSNGQTGNPICPGTSGIYYVTVTDANGCTSSASISLNCPCRILTDHYNNSALWTQLGTTVTVSSGKVNFSSIPGAADERIYRSLSSTLGNRWKAEFEFLADPNNNEGAAAGVAVNLFCLSNNTLTPYRIFPFTANMDYTDQNFINVSLLTPHYPGSNYQALTTINVTCKVGAPLWSTPLVPSAIINLPSWNQVYYASLERVDATHGVISIFSNSARTVHIQGSPVCFSIPAGVTGLNTLQHSNFDEADENRRFTGWVDNSIIDTCFQETACIAPLNIHFNDDCDSSLCVNVSGGIPPYYYQWNTTPVQTTVCATGIPPCTDVTVTVWDANGSSVTATHKKAYMTAIVTNATCSNNGAIDFNISCIDPACQPLTYLWSTGAVTQDISGLVQGTYCVTVTDACGNEYHCCYVVNCACPLWSGCIRFGSSPTNNGTLTALGNFIPVPGCTYTYHWYGDGTSAAYYNYIGSSATYTIPITPVGYPQIQYPVHLTVTNCCGDSVTLTYSPMVITLIGNHPCCSPNDGSIAIGSITGGSICIPSGAYNYQWQMKVGSVWTNISLANNLTGGTYRLKVTDCCGNIAYKQIVLNAYQYLSVTNITSANATLCQAPYNGTISFAINGICAPGTLTRTYTPFPNCTSCLPNPISITQILNTNGTINYTGMAPGVYVFTIAKCAGGANNSYTFTVVIHFPKPDIKFHFTNCNQQVCIETSACCSSTYLWSTGSISQCNTIGGPGGLVVGSTYTVTVTDCEGQTFTRSIKIPKVTSAIVKESCGNSNGKITLSVSNFGTGLTYLWSNNQVTNPAVNLAAGTYCVTITNNKGDKLECCYTLGSAPGVSFLIAQSGCRSHCITVLSGTPNYTYEWRECFTNNLVSTSSCYNQCGCYTVKVTDKNGCFSLMIYNISGVKINSGSNCGLCADMCGGCTPYTYIWSNGATTQCINCLTSGTYTVTVTDCNGVTYSCSSAKVVKPLSAQLLSVSSSSIEIKVKDGCPPYYCEFSINGGPAAALPLGDTSPTTFNIPNTSTIDFYAVNIHDDCGNAVPAFQFIAREAAGSIEESNGPTLAPNPNNGMFNIMFNESWQDESVEYEILDVTGKAVKQGKISVDSSLNYPVDMSDKPNGFYIIHYSTQHNKWTNKLVIQ